MHHRQQPGRGSGKKKLAGSPLLRFALALAHELGKTLGEIGALDLEELALWAAFLEDAPRRRERERVEEQWDRRIAMLACVTANSRFGGGNFRMEDFMPTREAVGGDSGGGDSGGGASGGEAEAERRLAAWAAAFGSAGGKSSKKKRNRKQP